MRLESVPGLPEGSGEGNAQLYSVCYWGAPLTVKPQPGIYSVNIRIFPNDASYLQTS